MLIAFIIWSACAVLFVGIGIGAYFSKKPAGFFANAEAPEVRDVKAYNKAVSIIWFVFAVLMELLGVPLLFCEQNSAKALIPILGTVVLVIGIMIAYHKVESKYRK